MYLGSILVPNDAVGEKEPDQGHNDDDHERGRHRLGDVGGQELLNEARE